MDGLWSEWWYWESCTHMCGGGTRKRHRVCEGKTEGGKECKGPAEENQQCNRTPCPGLVYYFS